MNLERSLKDNLSDTVNSRYNVFFWDYKKKRYIKKMLYQDFILNVGLHIDIYGTQYIVW